MIRSRAAVWSGESSSWNGPRLQTERGGTGPGVWRLERGRDPPRSPSSGAAPAHNGLLSFRESGRVAWSPGDAAPRSGNPRRWVPWPPPASLSLAFAKGRPHFKNTRQHPELPLYYTSLSLRGAWFCSDLAPSTLTWAPAGVAHWVGASSSK